MRLNHLACQRLRGAVSPATTTSSWQQALVSSALAACIALGPTAAPAIDMATPLSTLQSQEKTVEDLFERATPSVAYITTFVEKTDRLTMNAVEVPAGTGSGFVWDKSGHVRLRPCTLCRWPHGVPSDDLRRAYPSRRSSQIST